MKSRKPNNEMIEASKAVFMAIAYKETIKDTIETIKKDCLKQFNFFDTRTGKKINNPDKLYLALKEQEQDCDNYYLDCHRAYLKAGFKVKEYYCPLLIAESTEREAKKLLVEVSIEWLDMGTFEGIYYNMKAYKEFIELNLKLCSAFINKDDLLNNIN